VNAGPHIPIDRAIAGQRAGAAANAPQRSALALGLVGSLGEELLSALMSAPEYSAVFVGVTTMIGSASPKFRPWLVGRGTPVVDHAFIGISGEETFVPSASPIRRIGEAEVLEAARTARDAGATTLVLLAPLPALLQMGEAARALASVDEVALVALGFERLLIVRPTTPDDPRKAPNLMVGLVRAAGRALADLMLPSYARTLSARTAAPAILDALRGARPGVTVIGARELMAIVQEKHPKLLPRQPRLR
jgi:hypothetical protein